MPDDRLFHRKLQQSEKVTSLTDFEFRIWTAYVLTADDFGVLLNHPMALQQANRAIKPKPPRVVKRAIEHLLAVGLVQGFEWERQPYLYQWDWQYWQRIVYPRRTLLPRPPIERCCLDTKWLLSHHPGGKPIGRASAPDGWQISETISEKISETVSEIPPENISPMPLAVSRKPLAVSRGGGEPPPPNGRGKRVVFPGQRLTVFEWQLTECMRLLGPHVETFDLHAWFYDLDARILGEGLIPPDRDGGKWLKAELLAEAQRRGLPLREATATGAGNGLSERGRQNAAAMAEAAAAIKARGVSHGA